MPSPRPPSEAAVDPPSRAGDVAVAVAAAGGADETSTAAAMVVEPAPTLLPAVVGTAGAVVSVTEATVVDAVAGCTDFSTIGAAGRMTFGRGAARLEDVLGTEAGAGRLSLSFDLETFPLPCLSGQRAWQQALALPIAREESAGGICCGVSRAHGTRKFSEEITSLFLRSDFEADKTVGHES